MAEQLQRAVEDAADGPAITTALKVSREAHAVSAYPRSSDGTPVVSGGRGGKHRSVFGNSLRFARKILSVLSIPRVHQERWPRFSAPTNSQDNWLEFSQLNSEFVQLTSDCLQPNFHPAPFLTSLAPSIFFDLDSPHRPFRSTSDRLDDSGPTFVQDKDGGEVTRVEGAETLV